MRPANLRCLLASLSIVQNYYWALFSQILFLSSQRQRCCSIWLLADKEASATICLPLALACHMLLSMILATIQVKERWAWRHGGVSSDARLKNLDWWTINVFPIHKVRRRKPNGTVPMSMGRPVSTMKFFGEAQMAWRTIIRRNWTKRRHNKFA